MKMVRTFLVVTLAGMSLPAMAQTLSEMSQFAQSICGDIPAGSYTKNVIEGKVKADVTGLARLVVGSGSANLTDAKKQEIYNGIPFERLPNNIPTESMCKSELVKILLARKVSEDTNSVNQHTTGAHSPAINGNGNTVNAPGR